MKMTKHTFIFRLLVFITINLMAQDSSRFVIAKHFSEAPQIDGRLDDACWKQLPVITGFRQFNPEHSEPASFKTEAYIGYDRHNIYIAAMMYDPSPDSILQELGKRDTWVNADRFTIQFDTYHNQQNSYNYHVTASDVQIENMRQDWTYDAVWESNIQILDSGWSVEIRIPFTELRFPAADEQVWGLQLKRLIRRYREDAHWALEPKGYNNTLNSWGELRGIKNISQPKQLAFQPYLSTAIEHYPQEQSSDWSYSYSGGMDMKIGFNESYVMDMTLLPDFSQVKSDNKVKNLSAFEQTYAERRPFFIKNMSLFHRGGLLYTRRIGATPDGFYDVEDQLAPGEKIKSNPSRAQLINAFKISGRDQNGLALGVFNAITGNTYAKIKTADGDKRKHRTNPTENYNIVVLDKAMANNSSFYLTNTNVSRSHDNENANATAAGVNLYDKSTKYKLHASGVVTEKYNGRNDFTPQDDPGVKYYLSASKVKGKLHFNTYTEFKNDAYDINDMGINYRNNQQKFGGNITYKIFEPFWVLRNLNNSLSFWSNQRASTNKNENQAVRYSFSGTFINYLTIWGNYTYSIGKRYDYYEPRQEDMYYIRPHYESFSLNTSSDYRRDIALDASVYYAIDESSYEEVFLKVNPRLRLSDRWYLNPKFKVRNKENDRGYVSEMDTSNNVVFGNREITTIENSISSRFMFRNDISLNIWARHYWSVGTYNLFYTLLDNGHLNPNEDYQQNADFNYNTVNIDVNFDWELAPGSTLSLVWKNEILNENKNTELNLFQSLDETFQQNQRNTVSLKLLYYIDYDQIKRLSQNKS